MRAWSVLVLAMFLAGPGLRAECLLLCMKTGQPAAQSGCHDEPDSGGPTMAGHHDCATIAPAIMTAVKRAAADSSIRLLDRSAQSRAVASALRTDSWSHGSPPSARHTSAFVPLRI